MGGRGWDGATALRTPDFVLWIGPTVTRRAGDVNPPVTVRANARVCRVANTDTGVAVVFAMANVRCGRGVTGRLTSTARHGTFL